ncbi:MAG: class B sortase [Acutalibacteraceae bacterium]
MTESSKKRLWTAVLIAAVIVVLLCIAYLIFLISGQRMSDEDRAKYTQSTAQGTSAAPTNPGGIDFAALKKVNPEVVAWIRVDGTDIDYPVMRPSAEDDDYYLNHNYKRDYTSAGEIYMEKKNNASFLSPVTVLYGHNWRNNGYFRPLYQFKDEDFFNKNRYIYIYTPQQTLKYEIYAAYEYDSRHILNSFDFSDKEVLMEYLESTLAPKSMTKNVKSGVSFDRNSRIITLSTCVEGVRSSRYLVQAVLVESR